jgi:hypothetical protein
MAQAHMLFSADRARPAVTVPLFRVMLFKQRATSASEMSLMGAARSGPK